MMTTAIGGGTAWLIGCVPFLAGSRRWVGLMSGSSTFAALRADLSYPQTIGKACLKALPAVEASQGCLTRMIFGDMQGAGGDCLTASTIVQSMRERSRDDFRDGRIVTVDGWILSLTETRVYALAALLASPGESLE